MSRSHPNINEFYFEVIDTKEKAYWLGFLYADGYIIMPNGFGINLHKDEVDILTRFCDCIGANSDKITPRSDRNCVRIRIYSENLVNGLIKHGCVPKKSKIIQFPKLENRNLYLAFLLGYYDGDGQINTTRIASGSKLFIEQIKTTFDIPYKLIELNNKGKINGRVIYGSCFLLSLGAELFNEMMDNYQHSMQRKRKYFCTEEERIERIKENAWHGGNKQNKFDITKEELDKLVWKIPSERIAEKYGVSGSLITKRCRQWNIKKPPRGYWAKHRSRLKARSA